MSATTVGSMSHTESQFCTQIRDLFRATLHGRAQFGAMAAMLLGDFRAVVRKDWDVSAASAVAHYLTALDQVSARPSPALTDSEISFLHDADGFVDFALRNGLTFDTVASVLMHDLSELAGYAFKLDAAIADGCVLPQVTGWAKRNQESAIGTDEPLE